MQNCLARLDEVSLRLIRFDIEDIMIVSGAESMEEGLSTAL